MIHLRLSGIALIIGAIFHAVTMLVVYIVGREEGSKKAARTFLDEMRERGLYDA